MPLPMRALSCTVRRFVRCREVDEAVLLANASGYGLAASALGADLEHAHSIAQRLQAVRYASTSTPTSRPTCRSTGSSAPVSAWRSGRKACRPTPRSWCSIPASEVATDCLPVSRDGGGPGTRVPRRARAADPFAKGELMLQPTAVMAMFSMAAWRTGTIGGCRLNIAGIGYTLSGNARGYRCQLPVPVTAVSESFRCSEGV